MEKYYDIKMHRPKKWLNSTHTHTHTHTHNLLLKECLYPIIFKSFRERERERERERDEG